MSAASAPTGGFTEIATTNPEDVTVTSQDLRRWSVVAHLAHEPKLSDYLRCRAMEQESFERARKELGR